MRESVILSQSVYASVAHRYWRADWSAEQNRAAYGRDASSAGIGSNLRLEAALKTTGKSTNDPGEETLHSALAQLKARVDHRCLFAAESEFQNAPSTLENIAAKLALGLFAQDLDDATWEALTVWESEHLSCRISPGLQTATLMIHSHNLRLYLHGPIDPESGLVLARAPVQTAVENLLVKLNDLHSQGMQDWGPQVLKALQTTLPILQGVQIDLGRHEALVVHFER